MVTLGAGLEKNLMYMTPVWPRALGDSCALRSQGDRQQCKAWEGSRRRQTLNVGNAKGPCRNHMDFPDLIILKIQCGIRPKKKLPHISCLIAPGWALKRVSLNGQMQEMEENVKGTEASQTSWVMENVPDLVVEFLALLLAYGLAHMFNSL